jgi:hypothetical protein
LGGGGLGGGTTTAARIGFQAKLLKIDVDASMGEAHFLLSALVQARRAGTGIPAGTGTAGSSAAGSVGNTTAAIPTTTSTQYPFQIIAIGENTTYE